MPDLATLIRWHIDQSGDSLRDMARKTGEVVSYQSLSAYANGTLTQWPRDRKVFQALAELLGVDVTTVVLAFAKGWGLDVKRYGPRLAQLIPADADVLSPRNVDHVLNMIRTLINVDQQTHLSRADAKTVRKVRKQIAPPPGERRTAERRRTG